MNRNAYRGRNVEILFRNSVSDHPSVINAIKSAYSITGNFRTGISFSDRYRTRPADPVGGGEGVVEGVFLLYFTSM